VTAELVERRILGAVAFADATTGRRIRESLTLGAPSGVRFVRNHSAIYVVTQTAGLTAFTDAFVPTPALPAPTTLALTVADPNGTYLPRRFSLNVPRDPTPAAPLPANSVYSAVTVQLYRAPAAQTLPDWATVRAHVTRSSADVGGALVRVIRKSDTKRIGAGISDERGEALVIVPGIPLVNWDAGAGPVLASQIDVTIEAVFVAPGGSPPDPDALINQAASTSVDAKLGAGGMLTTTLTIPS
jgi:hypothetical protein